MASAKDLRRRIGSVKNTQQTTKAMKMVSAAKLRRAQEAIQNQRPYAKRIRTLIQTLAALPEVPVSSPLIRRAEDGAEGARKRVLLVIVTSDRGLCGGFNGNVIKAAQRWIKANQSSYESVELSFVGKKAYDFFKHRKVKIGTYYQELGGKVTFAKAKTLTDALVKRYLDGEVDEVKFIYNEFVNAVSQKVQIEAYLPLGGLDSADARPAEQAPMYLIKPSPAEVLAALIEKNFAIQTFRYLLESQAGEHGARMSAMDNATRNAGEMIRHLTLEYNKQRQASITKELLEIIAGSESQKAS
jgi:F-type H+-transporting ATPase subunit gamma